MKLSTKNFRSARPASRWVGIFFGSLLTLVLMQTTAAALQTNLTCGQAATILATGEAADPGDTSAITATLVGSAGLLTDLHCLFAPTVQSGNRSKCSCLTDMTDSAKPEYQQFAEEAGRRIAECAEWAPESQSSLSQIVLGASSIPCP